MSEPKRWVDRRGKRRVRRRKGRRYREVRLIGSCQTDAFVAIDGIVRAVVLLFIEMTVGVWDMEWRCV